MIRAIHNCARGDKKEYNSYADRFYGVAQAYLNLSGEREDEQNSQTFAMILLENANLPTVTFNKVVSTLIATGRSNPDSTEEYHQISAKRLRFLSEIFVKLTELSEQPVGSGNDARVDAMGTILESPETKECYRIIKNILSPHKFAMTEKSEGCFKRLRDAVAAIKDLQAESRPDEIATIDPAERGKVVKTMIGGRGLQNSGSYQKQFSTRLRGNCWACGKPDHVWKDCKCEMHPLNRKRANVEQEGQLPNKKQKDEENEDSAKDEDTKQNTKQYFQ